MPAYCDTIMTNGYYDYQTIANEGLLKKSDRLQRSLFQ
jgi:hypothetical protein